MAELKTELILNKAALDGLDVDFTAHFMKRAVMEGNRRKMTRMTRCGVFLVTSSKIYRKTS